MRHLREPVSGLTHLAAAIVALIAFIWLLFKIEHDVFHVVAVLVFAVTLIAMFVASASLHLWNGTERAIKRLQRLDHAAIYLTIAGTYTPMLLLGLTEPWRSTMLLIVWICAIIGVIYKLVFFKAPRIISTLSYVLLGTIPALVIPAWINRVPVPSTVFIIAGGIVYIAGAGIYAFEKPNLHRHFGFHELWHLFVIGGAALHFTGITVAII